jgi:hypothetical protein
MDLISNHSAVSAKKNFIFAQVYSGSQTPSSGEKQRKILFEELLASVKAVVRAIFPLGQTPEGDVLASTP